MQFFQHCRQPRPILAGLFLLSLLCYLALIPAPRVDGELIGSDGIGYYVYLRSVIIDHDLDLANEFDHYRAATKEQGLSPTGRAANKYPVGPAVLWAPFYLLAHGIALAGRALGFGLVPDGYGHLYQAAICIGSIVYGTAGFWLCYSSARRIFSPSAVLAAVVLLWLASNAIYYMVFQPSMAHMVSLFSVALVLSVWFRWFRTPDSPPPGLALLLGAAGGLVLLVRLQDAIFLLLPYGALLLQTLQSWRKGHAAQARRWLWCGLLAALATVLVFLPQLAAWKLIYGTWLAMPYLADSNEPFRWLQPQLVGVLVSPLRGLFVWHPVYLLALLGLVGVLLPRDRWLALALLALLTLNIYVVASWWAWWQGDSFGGRMFLNAMWAWVLGLSGLVEWAAAGRRRWPALLTIGGLLIAWNGLAVVQYQLDLLPRAAAITWQTLTIERLAFPWALLHRYLFARLPGL